MATSTYYELLGVSARATHEELRNAYRDKALGEHPDRHGGSDPREAAEAAERMREINNAWRVLGDPAGRAAYDAELARANRARSSQAAPADWDGPVAEKAWPSERPTSALAALLPLLLLVALLVAIAIFTAYAKTG